MSEATAPKESPRAVSSGNGETWEFAEGENSVTAVVVGEQAPRKAEDSKRITIRGGVRADLIRWWKGLRELRFWQVDEVAALLEEAPGKTWPPCLRTLDLRGCDLALLPDLPETLEELDVGFCENLRELPRNAPPKLERLFFEACPRLDVEIFIDHLRKQEAPVIEIDASGNGTVEKLNRFPFSLRKLVLEGCSKLKDVGKIVEMDALDHLDLRNCVALTHLPDLPRGLRHLFLHGADGLRTFHGQTVGQADLGHESREEGMKSQNVAPDFHTRLKFGQELALMPHAKLLLLGNGRMGKTTLAKRLVWDDLPEAEQRKHPTWKPVEGEPYTHSVSLKSWETFFDMPDWLREQWEAIPEARRPRLPLVENGEFAGKLRGTVRIWDFGGQELYHATHRVFAREGAVFLLFWTHRDPPEEPCPRKVDPREWDEWNRRRPLRYWLDYLDHVRVDRTGGRPLWNRLVCTQCPGGNPGDDKLAEWAEGIAATALPECDYIESVVEDREAAGPGIKGLETLKGWIHTACLDEANAGGRLIKPKFFADTSAFTESILRANAEQFQARNKTLLFEWEDWVRELKRFHQASNPQFPKMTAEDVQSVTTFLHEVGDLFQMTEAGRRAVLIDQKAAANLIYQILDPRSHLYAAIRTGRGRFIRRDIGECDEWRDLDERVKDVLLNYMAECGHIVKLADRTKSISDDDVYLANCRWLLPEYPDDDALGTCTGDDRRLREAADREMKGYRERGKEFAAEKFLFEDIEITELEYRDLTALVARELGLRNAFYFRNSVQCAEPKGIPGIFNMRWQPKGGDEGAYTGKVDAVLWGVDAPSLEELRYWLETLFAGSGSPYAGRYRPSIREAQSHDLLPGYHQGRLVTRDAFGISSSGKNLREVTAIRDWLSDRSIQSFWYLDPKVRERDDPELGSLKRLDNFLNGLLRENRMVLVISAEYLAGSEGKLLSQLEWPDLSEAKRVEQKALKDRCEENKYCAMELADAIVQLGRGQRKPEDLMVILKTGDKLRSRKLQPRIARLLKNMEQCFRDLHGIAEMEGNDRKHEAYKTLFERFKEANHDENFNQFIGIYGNEAEAVRIDSLGQTIERTDPEGGAEMVFQVNPEALRTAFEKRFAGLRFRE